MADVNLSPYTAEQQAMDRRRKMAEAMQQQAIAPIEMPTMPGVRVSPYAGLAKILQSYVAKRNLNKSDQEQKDYENRVSEDQAKFARNMGQYETVPGEVISRGTEKTYPMKENTTPWNQNVPAVDVSAGAMPVAGQPEQRAPARQIPLLNASLLESTNPLAFKTGQGKQMLFQYLMQQEAQKQAAAQRALEAQQAIHVSKPGETAFRLDASGKPVTVMNTPAIPSFEKVETRDPVTGLTIHKYVNKTELGNLGNVLAPYSGFVKDITEAQNAPESIKNNPLLLDVLGSNLNKTGGLPTEKDVVNSQLAEAQARAQLAYQGINLGKTEPLVKAKNPLITPVQKITTQAEIADTAKRSGKTIQQVTADAIAKGYKVQ